MKKNTFTLIDENNNEVVYDVLFTYESEETKKNYIVYTDKSKDETGKIRVYASTYNPESPTMDLEEVKTDKEWKVIETVLETIQEKIQEKQENISNEG